MRSVAVTNCIFIRGAKVAKKTIRPGTLRSTRLDASKSALCHIARLPENLRGGENSEAKCYEGLGSFTKQAQVAEE
jgi:hypothetical protein